MKSVYRYRKITDYSIKELINDEFVLSRLNLQNDPYEGKAYYDLNKIKDFFLNNPNYLKTYNEKKWYRLYEDIKDDYIINNSGNNINNQISRLSYIASLSYDHSNEVMWSHYANNGKGFVIEYDLDLLEEMAYSIGKTIFTGDINYIYKRIDNTDLIISILKLYLNSNISEEEKLASYNSFKQLLFTKSNKWQYENEYRIALIDFENKLEHINLFNIKPKAIYLGENINLSDKITLISICKDKNIDLYTMESNSFKSRDFKLYRKKIIIK